MKKTFLTCMAVVALLAIASGAGAITCTIDQRPAATLLIPYFTATFNADGTALSTGATAKDTLVTIGNASSAPMLAHVSVWSDRSELVLDFNIALTGFDIQSFSVAQVLRGFLPKTPINISHVSEVKDAHQVTINGDVCQNNASAPVYPAAGGYLRVRPTSAASPQDNAFATVAYGPGPFPSAFLFEVLDSLDATHDSRICDDGVDNVITNPIHGYITIDHSNYCTLANPNDPSYWTNDAGGMENNLFGDYIYTTGAGIGTFGLPAVAIEADASLADNTAAPTDPDDLTPGRRTFYRRYVQNADAFNTNGVGCNNIFPAPQAGFDCGFGDQREPLGLKYAARWFDTAAVTSFFNVWRASAGSAVAFPSTGLDSLLGGTAFGKCTTSEPAIVLTFFDEDENTVTLGCVVSPCGSAPPVNIPLETQRLQITSPSLGTHPSWPAGWVSMEFFNPGAPVGGTLDQAYVTYDFQGAAAFLEAGVPGAQLDPTNCQPLLVPVAPAAGGVTPTAPAIPVIVGTGP